jgi:hypothetical protein
VLPFAEKVGSESGGLIEAGGVGINDPDRVSIEEVVDMERDRDEGVILPARRGVHYCPVRNGSASKSKPHKRSKRRQSLYEVRNIFSEGRLKHASPQACK